jgi:hypothetical protein
MDTTDIRKLEIETTVMAIREVLMTYFKGSCVEFVTNSGDIYLSEKVMPRNYNYQRDIARLLDCRRLYIKGLPIMEVHKNENTVIYYDSILKRSPELRRIRKLLTKFIRAYLVSVKLEVKYGTITN